MLAVIYAVEAVRELHPELCAPATGRTVRRALAAEGIAIVRRAIRKSRVFVDDDGNAVVLLSTRHAASVRWKRLLHEYGHVRLHTTERGEVVRNLVSCTTGDVREDEANLFAALLVLGADATIEHPVAAAIVAKIVGQEHRRRIPQQLPLELPEKLPVYRPPSVRYGHGSHSGDDGRLPRLGRRPRLAGSSIGLGASHDSLRFDWSKEGKPLRFFHYTLGWIDVWDFLAVNRGKGRRRLLTLECGDRRADRRVFVISSTDRRRYVFAEGEKRHCGIKDLDRQIEAAEHVPTREGPATTRARLEHGQ